MKCYFIFTIVIIYGVILPENTLAKPPPSSNKLAITNKAPSTTMVTVAATVLGKKFGPIGTMALVEVIKA